MAYFFKHIVGVPYSKAKTSGRVDGLTEWTKAVVEQTQTLPRVREACILKVTFLLPPDKFPDDLPYGSDLDNLLKRFLDALNQTVFSETHGGDSCVISMHVTKTRVNSYEESGAILEVLPVKL